MKIRFLILAVFALVSASAYADTYTCTATNGTGIYALTVNGGTANLMVDGMIHNATGAGSEYLFDSPFAMGSVSFTTSPSLYLPTDGTMNDAMFEACVCDNAGNNVNLTCSR